jgi:CheY-like chemotaxis protein
VCSSSMTTKRRDTCWLGNSPRPERSSRPPKDAESALTVLQSEPIDVLVADLVLPGVNGLQLLERAPGRPPVAIAVTAFDDRVSRERALETGFNAYLSKPVDPLVLAQEIAQRAGPR